MNLPQILLTTLCAVLIAPLKVATACSVCFGDPGSPLVQSVSLGIWVLMGFIGGVLALFCVLFFNIRCRMKKLSAAHTT